MGINGGGYTFIPPSVIPQLHSSDVSYLLNNNDLARDVLLRISKPDGTEPYTVIKQFTNTGGISVFLTNYEDYTKPENTHLGEYIYLGITPAANVRNNNVQRFLANNVPITFTNCDRNPNANFAFYPNNNELRPIGRIQVPGISEAWRQKAVTPFSGRRMPLEYFMFTEMHFGGCGSYSSSDTWLTSHSPALGTALGLRYMNSYRKDSETFIRLLIFIV